MSKTAIELQRLQDELQIAELKTRCAVLNGLANAAEQAEKVLAKAPTEETYGERRNAFGVAKEAAEAMAGIVGTRSVYDRASLDVGGAGA